MSLILDAKQIYDCLRCSMVHRTATRGVRVWNVTMKTTIFANTQNNMRIKIVDAKQWICELSVITSCHDGECNKFHYY